MYLEASRGRENQGAGQAKRPVVGAHGSTGAIPPQGAGEEKRRSAMRGMGRIFKRGEIYWIAYCHRGREHRESSGSTKEADARRLLKKRLGEIGQGKLMGPTEERVTFDALAADYLQEYALRGPRSLRWAKERVAHLGGSFGMDRALDITTSRIRAYRQVRLQEGAAPATVNRDLAALSRMFTLAIQAGRLSTRPHIPRLQEGRPRQGFMEHPEYLAIRAHLPPAYQDVLDFGYHSGWRRGEIVRLAWQDVDRAAGVIRLRPELSKNKDGRLLVLSPPLKEVIERRWHAQILSCPFVFHRNGQPIGDWRKSWGRACTVAGLPRKLFHDLRRTVVRNLVRAGVPERVGMSMTGHKTRSVFDRYNIVSEADLKQATTRLADYVATQSSARG
jgi:integrase